MKKRFLTVLGGMLLGVSGLMAQEIATWEDWCKSAVTFTFDDAANEWSSHNWAAEQLKGYHFKATFYVVTQWTGSRWTEYKKLAELGHEIGSHTDSHSSNASECASSKRTIEQNIGRPCLTIAYPNCVNPGTDAVLSNYIGGRICGGQINSKSPRDLDKLDCAICGDQGINSSRRSGWQEGMIDKCESANGGWCVFLIHGIQGYAGDGSFSPTDQDAFTETLSWLDQNRKDYWVCTFRDAIMYFKERDNASFKKISSDATSDTYSLTLNSSLTSNKLCKWDYPLSVRVPVQDGWSDIKVTQSDNEIESSVSGGYVYFKAVPGGGDIVVGSAAPAIPDPEFSIEKLSSDKFCTDSTYTVKWTMSGDANDRTYTLNFGTGASSTEISIADVDASSEWGETASNPYWTVDKILSDDGAHGGSSRWGSMTGSNEWVEFNLGKTQTVGGVMIDECTEYDVISSFEIQYDENGSWKTAYTGTKVGNDFKATFSPVSTSKMRLFIKSAGDGCNINYVEFQGVSGYVIKEGIAASGSIEWKPKSAGNGMLTITTSKGKVLAQTSSIKVENCGGTTIDPGQNPGTNPGSTGASTFFDENGAYFGPDCEGTDNIKNETGAYFTGDYTSPFKTYLGKSDEEIQAKMDKLWNHYFKGDNNSTVYYENGNEAYVMDINNKDVRSEGMSYGMMICVQTNHQQEFDKLWKFAKNHMQHTNGQWQGYFKWKCNTDGSAQDANCAPDGEMYFTMALLLAANRWNNDSYRKDAQYILSNMWKNGTGSLFNESENVITFQPYNCYTFGDPSYDLPAFLECFYRWSDSNNNRWAQTIPATRNHLKKSSNSSTGLFSDYSNFDGTPNGMTDVSKNYMYDAMRCAMNVGMDYYLFGKDKSTQEEMIKRLINFFEKDGYKHARFTWDGQVVNANDGYTIGEMGANAVACYALMGNDQYQDIIKKNLKMAWDANLMTGQYRYYDGLVHYLAMLHLSGNFRIWKQAPKAEAKTVEVNEYNGVTYTEETTIDSFEDCQLYKVTIKPSKGNGTDVEEIAGENAIVLMPNPAENYFVVKSAQEIESIAIINMVGQIVYNQMGSEMVELNIPAGTYMVRIVTADGNSSIQKLIVK